MRHRPRTPCSLVCWPPLAAAGFVWAIQRIPSHNSLRSMTTAMTTATVSQRPTAGIETDRAAPRSTQSVDLDQRYSRNAPFAMGSDAAPRGRHKETGYATGSALGSDCPQRPAPPSRATDSGYHPIGLHGLHADRRRAGLAGLCRAAIVRPTELRRSHRLVRIPTCASGAVQTWNPNHALWQQSAPR
jgi:hypothetical protein